MYLLVQASCSRALMTSSSPGTSAVLDKQRQSLRYPQARVIVLNDDVNTFEHVVECLCRTIPGLTTDQAGIWRIESMVREPPRFGVVLLNQQTLPTAGW